MFTGTDIVKFFQENSALAVFLTVAIGFWIGKFRFGNFSLGIVTSVLLVGVVVGQMNIRIPEPAKTLFFLMFLFSIGYSVGPQFFRGLRKDGLPQVWLRGSRLRDVSALGMGLRDRHGLRRGAGGRPAGRLADDVGRHRSRHRYDSRAARRTRHGPERDAGLLRGHLHLRHGRIGLGTRHPRPEAARRRRESKAGGQTDGIANGGRHEPQSGIRPGGAYDRFPAPSAPTTSGSSRGGRYASSSNTWPGSRGFVERLRQQGSVKDPSPKTVIRRGDEIVVSGRRRFVIEEETWIGREVEDKELVNFSVETLPVVVNKKGVAGKTVRTLLKEKYMHGVSIRSIRRANVQIPVLGGGKLDAGDRIELVGLRQDVERAAEEIGFSDAPTEKSSMTLVGMGIFLGGLIFGWAFVTRIGNVPLSLTVSGGVLIAGLICGWLRAKRPTLGGVPEPSVWFMNNVGLNVFIAIVGITTGPSFVRGFQEVGWSLFLVGAVATTIPLVAGIFIGKYLFRFNEAIVLGCVSGSRTTTAALGAVEETLESNVPAMGYTITYAIGNTLLIIWGVVIVLLVA